LAGGSDEGGPGAGTIFSEDQEDERLEVMKKQLLALSTQLSAAVFKLWREIWNALIGLGLAAVLYVVVEVLEAL
jgi:hypothetical protein